MADSTMTAPAAMREARTDDTGTVERSAVLGHRRSPAQHLDREMAAGSSEQVALREVPFLTQTGLRAVPDSASGQALEQALGVPLPRHGGQVTGDDTVSVLWLSPDEFLLVGPDEAQSGVAPAERAEQLAAALGERPGQVVDLSANRTTLELTGPRARDVLEKSVRLDLHPRAFPVGQVVSTLLETTPVILWRSGEQTWRVMPRSSFTTHVVRWLLDGMREYV